MMIKGEPGAYLHHGAALPQRESNALLVLERHPPDGFVLRYEFPDQVARLEIPDLHAPITTGADDPRVIELQASHAVIVGCQSMDGAVALNRPDANRAIRSTRDKRVTTHLELSNQRGVALEDPSTLAERIS